MRGVYLLHFDEPYKHAKHYLGFAEDIEVRVEQHRQGQGARLTQVIREAGIGFTLVRVWRGGDRTLERRLKGRGLTHVCPTCSPDSAMSHGHTDLAEAHRRENPHTVRDGSGKFMKEEAA